MHSGNSLAVKNVTCGLTRPSNLPKLVENDVFQVIGADAPAAIDQAPGGRLVAADVSSCAGSRLWLGGSREVCTEALAARGTSQRDEFGSP